MSSPATAHRQEGLAAPPRQVRLNGYGRFCRAGCWLVFLAGGVLPSAWHDARVLHRDVSLERSGTVTSAILYNKTSALVYQRQGQTTKLTLDYRFVAEGQPVEVAVDVDGEIFDASKIGSTKPVTYLPGHPEIHALGPKPDSRTLRADAADSGLLTLVAWALFGLPMSLVERAIRRQRHLLRDGAHASALVQSAARSRIAMNGNVYRHNNVKYTFQTSSGESLSRKTDVNWHEIRPGDRLPLLYLPNRPRTNRLLVELTMLELARAE